MRVRVGSVVIALGLGVLLVACGGGTSSKSTAPTTTGATTPSTSTSTTPATTTPTTTPATTSSTSTPTTSTAVLRHTSGEATALIKRLYDPYAGATIDTPVAGNCFWPQTGRPCPIALSDVMTAGLVARLNRVAHEGTGIDPVNCAQNYPVRVSYDPPAPSGGAVTIVVHTLYGTPPALRDTPIRVTVDLNTLKLTDLACPPTS